MLTSSTRASPLHVLLALSVLLGGTLVHAFSSGHSTASTRTSNALFPTSGSLTKVTRKASSSFSLHEASTTGDQEDWSNAFQEQSSMPKKTQKASTAAMWRFGIYHAQIIYVAGVVSQILNIPNFGLGLNFCINFGVLRAALIRTVALLAIPKILLAVRGGLTALVSDKQMESTKQTDNAPLLTALALLGWSHPSSSSKSSKFQVLLEAAGKACLIGGMVGLSEELLFRGVLQTALSRHVGVKLAIVLQSLTFGVLHPTTPLYMAITGVVGLGFGAMYATSSNLAVPILCHGLYNAITLFRAHLEVTKMSIDELENLVALES